MEEFKRGQTFIDYKAIDWTGKPGPKYFIGLSSAYDIDDKIVCFVMDTEKHFEKYHLDCNPLHLRFIIPPNTFSFISRHTSIILSKEAIYKLSEIYSGNIKLLDMAADNLARQIKNCINWRYILPKHKEMIINSFKI